MNVGCRLGTRNFRRRYSCVYVNSYNSGSRVCTSNFIPVHFAANDAFYRNHSSHFEKHKTAFEEGAADDADILAGRDEYTIEVASDNNSITREEKTSSMEKA